jgi:hypothetical protein
MGMSVVDPRDTHDGSALRCPRCSSRLTPLSGADILRFLCDEGHEVDGPQLLAAGTISALAELEDMLHAWESRADQLEITVRSAHRHGQPAVAEVYQRQLEAARLRVRAIRGALEHARRYRLSSSERR